MIRSVTDSPESRPELIEALRQSKIAIPLNKGLEDGLLPKDFRPLTLNSPAGFPVLATFTSVEKAGPWVKNEPAYSNVLLTDFLWALSMTRPPFGLSVNPGYKYSFVMSPTEVQAVADGSSSAT